MSEHDTELDDALSDADDVLRSGTDTVAAEEPQESVEQVGVATSGRWPAVSSA